MQKFCPLIFCLLLIIESYGQSRQDKKIIKDIEQLLEEKYSSIAPGAAVLIAKKGEVIFNKAYGTANIELDVPMRTDMVFRIGSISKQFTAVAILQLVEKDKISPQDFGFFARHKIPLQQLPNQKRFATCRR